MSATLRKLQRLRVKSESTFGSEESGSVGSFTDVRFDTAEDTLENEMLEDAATVQRFYQRHKKVPGRTRVESFNVEMSLLPTGTALNSSASAPGSTPTFGHGVILKQGLGGYNADKGTTEDGTASSTASALEVSDASVLSAGQAIGVTVGGNVELAVIRSISGTTVTPYMDFSGAPDDAAEVLNAHTFYLTDDPSASLQYILEGAHKDPSTDREDIVWLLGCAVNELGFTHNTAELIKMNLGHAGREWKHDEDVGTPLAGAETSLQSASYTDTDVPVQFISSKVFLGKVNSFPGTHRTIDPQEISFSPNVNRIEIPSPQAVNGILQYQMAPDGPMATVEITGHLTADELREFQQAIQNKDDYYFAVQAGQSSGKIGFVAAPRCQVVNIQRATAGDQLAGYTVTLEALEANAGASTELERSPFIVGVM